MRQPILALCLILGLLAAPLGGGLGLVAAKAGQTHQMTAQDGDQPPCHDEGKPSGHHPKIVLDGFTCCPQAAIFLPSFSSDMTAPIGKAVQLAKAAPVAKTASWQPPDKPPRS